MKLLGKKASLRRHEKDLLFTGAACQAHGKPEVQAIGKLCLDHVTTVRDVRRRLEEGEDLLVVAEALLIAKDAVRDGRIVGLGSFADHLGSGERERILRLPPSTIARLGYAEETTEIDTVITRLAQLPTDHPLRVEYQAQLEQDNAAFKDAAAKKQETEQLLAAVRFAVTTAKVESDRFRETQYGQLVALVGKKEAETFYRQWTSRAAAEEDDADPAAPAPTPPAP